MVHADSNATPTNASSRAPGVVSSVDSPWPNVGQMDAFYGDDDPLLMQSPDDDSDIRPQDYELCSPVVVYPNLDNPQEDTALAPEDNVPRPAKRQSVAPATVTSGSPPTAAPRTPGATRSVAPATSPHGGVTAPGG